MRPRPLRSPPSAPFALSLPRVVALPLPDGHGGSQRCRGRCRLGGYAPPPPSWEAHPTVVAAAPARPVAAPPRSCSRCLGHPWRCFRGARVHPARGRASAFSFPRVNGSLRFAAAMAAASPCASLADALLAARSIWLNKMYIMLTDGSRPSRRTRQSEPPPPPSPTRWSKEDESTAALSTASNSTAQELAEWNARPNSEFQTKNEIMEDEDWEPVMLYLMSGATKFQCGFNARSHLWIYLGTTSRFQWNQLMMLIIRSLLLPAS